MALIEKLNAIGDAIRSKTGKEDKLTLDDMVTEIEGIAVGGDNDIEDGLVDGTITEYYNDRVTSLGSFAFGYNRNLEMVNLPNVETIGDFAFQQCSKLKTAYIPKLKTKGDGSGACFSYCTSLESVDFPLLNVYISRLFEYCSNLKNVNLPLLPGLGANMFNTCIALKEVYFPSVTIAYSNACTNCTSLEIVIFDSKVGFIRQTIFNNCTSLTALVLRNEEISTLSYTNVFQGTPIEAGTGYIYVPKALIEDYKVATNWINFAEQFRAIEDYPEICGGAENG